MSLKPISEQSLLDVKNIAAHYGKVLAIRDVSFSVYEKKVIGIIGRNGAGKSTVLKLISGLIRPTSGSIWFRGDRIDGLAVYKIVELGIVHVPEGRRLFTKMTVKENLRIGSRMARNGKRIEENMQKVFRYFPILLERINQNANLLSGGEQQMLAIARGLMSQPTLLLLDEPTLGLSPLMSEQIGRVISDIMIEGITLILAEQNARLALRLSHEAYVLETGTVVLEGATDELIHNEEVKRAYL